MLLLTLTFVSLLVGSVITSTPPWSHEHGQHEHNIADYIIVGGGPAGFVLAEQLSLDPNVTVILLEAGPDGTNSSLINTPGFAGLLAPSEFSWNFTSQPDPNLNGVAPPLAQGHVLGGGSAINYLAYCRGAASVFDEWAELSGDPELAWDNFIHDYEATAHCASALSDYQQLVNTSVYGDGPLEVSHAGSLNGLDPYAFDAMKVVLGLPEVDFSSGSGTGVTEGVSTVRVSNRTRDYALEAFGWQLASRSNAQIVHDAWVTQVGFSGKRATSVTYATSDNATHLLHAREIIISAGAIGSPKLLMLSGVGPASHLQALDIPVVADISDLGSNLFDHHISIIEVEVAPSVETAWKLEYNATLAALSEAQYAANGGGFLSTTASYAIERVPDAVFAAVNDTFHSSLPADRGQLLYQNTVAAFLPNPPNVSIASPFVALVQPEASGYIHLASADYRDDPLIYSNYYGSPGDKAAILYGYKTLRKMLQSDILADIVLREIYPGPNVTSDEQLWQAIQQSAQTFHHPHGTVALGKVLDTDFRIKGLEGIRVVDSSIFPSSPNCHLQATTYALAHRAARKIRQGQ